LIQIIVTLYRKYTSNTDIVIIRGQTYILGLYGVLGLYSTV
jgi:hypothetical protein